MYSNLRQALLDLEKAGMLKRVHEEVDPYLEMAEIARQAFDNGGPALLFEHVKGSRFMAAANIFGTRERMDFLFRDTIDRTKTAVQFKADPVGFLKHANPAKLLRAASAGIRALPHKSGSIGDFEECTLADLPQIVSWPDDGGAFLTLPQVATRPSESAGALQTNLGMYRVQISGNEYAEDECGLHYQIKRDIARHHQKAIEEGRPLKVSVFLGGPPAHTIAAVMPMPENLSELTFAGMLAGRRFRYFVHDGYLVSSDADFCILGELAPDLKPEGPFGDHVGYYSGKHPFPYMKVHKVLCKKDAIYPFTAVGRPPKEDTIFGEFIHRITEPMVPSSIPGVHAVHAVDAAGVHPLCLALASERYIPYASPEKREPMELLKTANALLGFNQVSLSKYLFIAAKEDSPQLDVKDVPAFFAHVLERVDFARDLHFQTSTTIDTLDYTGTSLNHGSKLVIAAAGKQRRKLRNSKADLDSLQLPEGFGRAQIPMAGVLAIEGPAYPSNLDTLVKALEHWEFRENYPWISVIDYKAGAELNDFLWLTFTRSDPAQDIYGINEKTTQKHWAIEPPLIVDARQKPHHQKPLSVARSVTESAAKILSHLCLACMLMFAAIAAGPAIAAEHANAATPASAKATASASAQFQPYQGAVSHALVKQTFNPQGPGNGQASPRSRSIYANVNSAADHSAGRKFSASYCDPEDYYDTVHVRRTKHFQIFYTLSGIHGTTDKFVDSVEVVVEKVWGLYVDKLKMLSPKSKSTTAFFQQNVEDGFYPIEIVDISNARDPSVICESGCLGATITTGDADNSELSQIYLDNDFRYAPRTWSSNATITTHGKECRYDIAETPIKSGNCDYTKDEGKSIRITLFHELYHSIQMRYVNLFKTKTFWLEAAASGMEEIAAPDVNDYISNLESLILHAGTPIDSLYTDYAASPLLLYLYHQMGADADRLILEGFQKEPYKIFQDQLAKAAERKGLKADSLFHDFAIRLLFSGKRSADVDREFWISDDQELWPTADPETLSVQIPSLSKLAFKYYRGERPSLYDFKGRASAALFRDGRASIRDVANIASLDSIITDAFQYDSLIWILSRFDEDAYIPEAVVDSSLKAFPTPWRGGKLCFSVLPENRKFIEIRNSRGDLVTRLDYTHATHCIDESTVKANMAPGVYGFRAGNSGKLKKFLIIY